MFFPSTIALALLSASSALAAPTKVYKRQATPTAQMNLSPSTIAEAGGNVPDTQPPPTLSPATLNDFQIANFLENIESAFFQAGVTNLTTWGTTGFPSNTLDVVSRVAAQEQVHVATFEDLLTHFNTSIIPPCQYTFPVTNTQEFLSLAQIITSVGIGAVIDIAANVALQDPVLLQNIASTVTVEARHDAFFRGAALGLSPNPSPQDTRISAAWALNLALPFVVKDSCDLFPEVTIFPPLSVVNPVAPSITTSLTNATSGTITFTTTANATADMFIGWVNQANTVVYTPVTLGGEGNGMATITTTMPPGMAGIGFAALTNQSSAPDVGTLTAATVAGPAVVQVS
jgi:hypothetical protein